jgi:guanylate kinase
VKKEKTKIFIISGPSRVGKNAIMAGLLKKKLNLERAITATTRAKRQGEIQNKDYYFLNRQEFEKKIKQGYFLEWATLRGGEYFGTPANEVARIKKKNKNVLITVDVQGAQQLSKKLKNIVKIFIKPDSLENLKRRMKLAGFNKERIQTRLADAKRELKEVKKYNYIVVNKEGKLDEAIEEIEKIITKESI